MVGQITTAVLARCRCCTRLDRKARKNLLLCAISRSTKGASHVRRTDNYLLHESYITFDNIKPNKRDSLAHSLRL